jgi:2-polyprenyl-3-methyl-5-hydroxy-6-metoxy-1,4-benzoquinol methylase
MSIIVKTDNAVALDSLDHLVPHGTMKDNSRNPVFNRKLYGLFPHRPLYIMDLGCSGGGFVKDCLDDGHRAIGLEGSDYSLIRKRAEWATIPDALFTCDITKPFSVLENRIGLRFHAITAWEVMEHIPEEGLPQLFGNIARHLHDGGLCIASVSTLQKYHHVTVKTKDWWLAVVSDHGFEHLERLVSYFGSDWIRGPHQNAPESFHLVLTKHPLHDELPGGDPMIDT